MTLHWWNHWFWITFWAILAVCLCGPTSPSDGTLQEAIGGGQGAAAITSEPIAPELARRTGKAIGRSPPKVVPPLLSTPPGVYKQRVSIVFPLPVSSDSEDEGAHLNPNFGDKEEDEEIELPTTTTMATTVIKKNVTKVNETLIKENVTVESSDVNKVKNRTVSIDNSTDNVTLKLIPIAKDVHSNNSKKIENRGNITISTTTVPTTTSTESDIAVPITDPASIKNDSINIIIDESPIVSTVRALSLETNVGRRAADVPTNTLTSDFHEDQGLDAGAVAGICFGTLVLMALAGAVSFVLYRRRYLNKPQTLNDKCSNPDSSGYIDDSTIRENSEEMYSLDNDSFLNSLEAMTIQNYWTDSVKHTKL